MRIIQSFGRWLHFRCVFFPTSHICISLMMMVSGASGNRHINTSIDFNHQYNYFIITDVTEKYHRSIFLYIYFFIHLILHIVTKIKQQKQQQSTNFYYRAHLSLTVHKTIDFIICNDTYTHDVAVLQHVHSI